MSPLYGAIEAGGTKFVCAIGSGPGALAAETRIPTTTPAATVAAAIEFFQAQQTHLGPLAAVGVGSFGPLDLQSGSPTYGYITSTPKPGWANVDLVGPLTQALRVPVGFDTDVNAAALGEWRWGAGQGLDNLIYLTVGTGIGGGGLVGGRPIHGLIHPEMGHIRVAHDHQADPFPGTCPYHGDCLEGLACGPAIERRWGQPGGQLPDDHPAWPLEALYLAHGLATLICVLSPQRIVLGGGVMAQAQLLPLIRAELPRLLNGYVRSAWLGERIADYIVPPALGARAGILGAIALAQAARPQTPELALADLAMHTNGERRFVGSHYPRGLKGEQIPLAARIFAVVEVWDALRSDSPFRLAWPEYRVQEYLRCEARTRFEAQIVDAFMALTAQRATPAPETAH